MTGTVAQLISLVSFGNEFLNTGIMPLGIYPDNSTFQFCNSVKYVNFKKSLFTSKIKEVSFANDPLQWLILLKKEGCKKLALYFKNSEDQSKALDHQLAGLIGGGGMWFIEAIYKNYSDFMVNNWAVTNEKAVDRRIWSVRYGVTAWQQPTINLQFEFFEIKEELNSVLTNIEDFAFTHLKGINSVKSLPSPCVLCTVIIPL